MSNYVCDLPKELISLVRYVLRSFYDFELYLVMDMLVHYPCIKEEQLVEILKLDGKKVREYLAQLKAEKFVNEKLVVETTGDNKQTKYNYYYINYKMMVNVVKYKLDNMRKQIELEEKQLTCRASYKCLHCGRQYTDLDVVDLFMTNMRCITCEEGRVDEDASSLPKAQSRNLVANFNTQTRPISDLLQLVEHINLAPHILSPPPRDYSSIIDGKNGSRDQSHQAIANSINESDHKWSGDKTRNADLVSQTSITITISSNENGITLNDRIQSTAALNNHVTNDVIDGIIPDNSLSVINRSKMFKVQSAPILDNQQVPQLQQQQQINRSSKNLEEMIMDILIKYENKSMNNHNKKLNGYNNNENKKRDYNQTSDDFATESLLNDLNHSEEDDINNNISKKRKLNGNLLIIKINIMAKFFFIFINNQAHIQIWTLINHFMITVQ